MSIKVTVALYATLMKYHPKKKGMEPFSVELKKGSTVEDLANLLSLPKDEVKQVFVNGRYVEQDTVLSAGQKVAIFPPLGGG